MSRIGKKPIVIPSGVQVEWKEAERLLIVKGPLGELSRIIHNNAVLSIEKEEITVTVEDPTKKFQKSIWGTTRSVIQNMVSGVVSGFSKQLELNGVGYRMESSTDKLTMFLGFSHPVEMIIPNNIKIEIKKNLISGTSANKEILGNFFSKIFNLRPCDPYKHKGFKVPGLFYPKKAINTGK